MQRCWHDIAFLLVVLSTAFTAASACTPIICSSSLSWSRSLGWAGTLNCTPEDAPGLVIHPALLAWPGAAQAGWTQALLQQRWAESSRPPALLSAAGRCLTLSIQHSHVQQLDLATLGSNVSALYSASSGAHVVLQDSWFVGLLGGGVLRAQHAGVVGLERVRLEQVQPRPQTAAVQVDNSAQLAITNSTFQGSTGQAAGSVMADRVAAVQVSESAFINNTGTGDNLQGGAGALLMRNVSNVTVTDARFLSNTALMGAGGALQCADCGQQAYHRLVFAENAALYGLGGALHQTGMSRATHVHGCKFSRNEASLNGGAMSSVMVNATTCVDSVADCRLVVVNCTFEHNTAGAGSNSGGGGGGGIYVEQLTTTRRAVLIVNSRFVNNTARGQVAFSLDVDARGTGAAVAVLGQHNLCAFLYNSIMHRNRATYGGGAVSSVWGGGVVIRNSSLEHNTAGVQGGAVLVYKVIMNLAHVLTMLEQLNTTVLLPVLDAPLTTGGTLTPAHNSSTLPNAYLLTGVVSLAGCRLAHNRAGHSGGDIHAWLALQQKLVIYGCSMYNSSAGLLGGSTKVIGAITAVAGSSFVGCSAGAGGGGALHVDGGDSSVLTAAYNTWAMSLHLIRSALINNTAAGHGGAVAISRLTSVSMIDSLVQGNTASAGAGGGLRAADVQQLAVEGSVLARNEAVDGPGGGIACSRCTIVAITNSSIVGNRALQGGGLAVQGTRDPSWMALVSSTVDNNAAILPLEANSTSRKPAPPVITPLMGRFIPAAQAAGSQAANDLSSSAGGAGLQSPEHADHYADLPGVGGGLRLLGATLLTYNSSLQCNAAARLGAAAAVEQACWQADRAAESLAGLHALMTDPSKYKCSFTYLSTDTVAGNTPGPSHAAMTCPTAMPQHFCEGSTNTCAAAAAAHDNSSRRKGSARNGTALGAAEAVATALQPGEVLGAPSLFFTSAVSLTEPGSLAAVPRSPPFLSGCRLALKDAASYVQLANSVRKECDVASTTWGGGCKCLQNWVYTALDGSQIGPISGCRTVDWAVPWCPVDVTSCKGLPCGSWDSCAKNGDNVTLPVRPPLKIVESGNCSRSWQPEQAVQAHCSSPVHKQPAAAPSLSSSSSTAPYAAQAAPGMSSKQVFSMSAPTQLLLWTRPTSVAPSDAAVVPGGSGYATFEGVVPADCLGGRDKVGELGGKVGQAKAWGGARALVVESSTLWTLPPLTVVLADQAGLPVPVKHLPLAAPQPLAVTLQVLHQDTSAAHLNASQQWAQREEEAGAELAGGQPRLAHRASVSGGAVLRYARLEDHVTLFHGGLPCNSSNSRDLNHAPLQLPLQQLLHVELPALRVHAAPGAYWLKITDTSLPSSLAAPAPACVLVRVSACELGQVAAAAGSSDHQAGTPAAATAASSQSSDSESARNMSDSTCKPCEAGTYSFTPGATACQACPAGGGCPGGAAVVASAGWWAPSPVSGQLLQCLHPSACQAVGGQAHVLVQLQAAVAAAQGVLFAATHAMPAPASRQLLQQQQADYRAAATANNSVSAEKAWDVGQYWAAQCAAGHRGPLCGKCIPSSSPAAPGWVPYAGRGCAHCSGHVWLLVALQVVGFLLLLSLVVLATSRAWEAGLHGVACARLQVLQVLTLYLQLLGLLPLLRTPWPSGVEGLLLVISSIMYGTSGLGSFSLGLDCLLDALSTQHAPGQDHATSVNSGSGGGGGEAYLPAPAVRLLVKVLLLPFAVCMVGVLLLVVSRALLRAWRRSCLIGVSPARLHSSLPKLLISYRSVPEPYAGASADSANASSATSPGETGGAAVPAEAGPSSVPAYSSSSSSSSSRQMLFGVPVTKLLLLVLISLQVLYPGMMYSALTVFYCVPVSLPVGAVHAGTGRVLGQVPISSLLPGVVGPSGAISQQAVETHTARLWVLDMEQQCYHGYHLKVLLPLAVLVLCFIGVGLPLCVAAVAAAAMARTRRAQQPDYVNCVQLSCPQLLEQPLGPEPSLHSPLPAVVGLDGGVLQKQASLGSQHLSRQTSSIVDSVADMYRPCPSSTPKPAGGALCRQTSGAFDPPSRMPSLLLTIGSGSTAGPPSAPCSSLAALRELPLQPGEGRPRLATGAAGDASFWYVILSRCISGSVRDGMQWWPAAQLLLLCALVAAAVFGAPAGPAMQPGFVLLVTGVMIAAVVVCRPYSSPQKTCLVLLCLLVMAGLLYVAQMLAVCAPAVMLGAASQLCVLSVPQGVTAAILLGLLLLPVACAVWSTRKELAAAVCRVAAVVKQRVGQLWGAP